MPRRLLLFVSVIVFADTALFAALTPILPDLVDDFDLSKSAAGVLFGAYTAGIFLFSIPTGLMAARLGIRPTLLTGLAVTGIASLGVAFADSILVLDLARFLQGAGSAASWAGAFGWLASAAPRERRGEVLGSALGAAIVGALLGPVIGSIAHAIGRDVVFTATALSQGALMLWALSMSPVGAEGGTLASLREAANDPRARAAMWLVALPGLLFGTMAVLVPLRLDALGAGAFVIGAAWVGAGVLEAAVSPVTGRLSDRVGRLVPAITGVALSGVMMLLLPLPDTTWAVVVLVVLTAPAIGVLWAPANALMSDRAEHHGVSQGLAFALMNLAWAGGETAGAAGSARLADATRDAVPYLSLAAVCAITIVVLVRINRRPVAV